MDTATTSDYRALALLVLIMIAAPAHAHARWEALFYIGKSWTLDSDVRLQTSPDTDLTLKGVSWDDHSFDGPLYYGYRVSHWPEGSAWGLALDFTHAKIYVKRDELVRVSGVRNGVPVDERLDVGTELDHFNLSHGFNFLTLNLLHRWQTGSETRVHTGLGIGVIIPHVEATIAGEAESRYQFGGFAGQALLGLSRHVSDPVSVFTEYKIGYASVDVDIGSRSRLRTEPWTHQVVIGPQLKF